VALRVFVFRFRKIRFDLGAPALQTAKLCMKAKDFASAAVRDTNFLLYLSSMIMLVIGLARVVCKVG